MPSIADSTQHLKSILGNEYEAFLQSLGNVPPISLRLNPNKTDNTHSPIFAQTEAVAWCEQGVYLAQRPSFTLDPLLHAGAYYVQEASSMFVAQALLQTCELNQPLNVLDMCAAPGGKSTLLASLLSAESCLLANEIVRPRAHILAENLAKWGSIHTAVTCNDPAHFEPLANCFDVVLCDAPCSGEGMFRKTPEAMDEWSLAAMQGCATRQQRVLLNAANLVVQNGVLLYSTCTFNETENETQVAALLNNTDFDYSCERLQLQPEWGIVESTRLLPNGKTLYGYRFYPHRVRGEGLFMACLRRLDSPTHTPRRPKHLPEKVQVITPKNAAHLEKWLLDPKQYVYILYRDEVFALTQNLWAQWKIWANSTLYWLNMGIKMGKLAGNDLIPAPDLALSCAISPQIPDWALSYEQAIQYLRRNEISTDPEFKASKGWHTVSYQNRRLGWVKIIQDRVNNYYPKEWRIKMA